jgi:azurin
MTSLENDMLKLTDHRQVAHVKWADGASEPDVQCDEKAMSEHKNSKFLALVRGPRSLDELFDAF